MKNAVRDKLRAGGTPMGVMAFDFFTPGLAPTLAQAGAEFVLLDMEHSGAGIDTIKMQCALARGAGIVPMVRVPACLQPRTEAVEFGDVGERRLVAGQPGRGDRVQRLVGARLEGAAVTSGEGAPRVGVGGDLERRIGSEGADRRNRQGHGAGRTEERTSVDRGPTSRAGDLDANPWIAPDRVSPYTRRSSVERTISTSNSRPAEGT